jgi:hypothetical protein
MLMLLRRSSGQTMRWANARAVAACVQMTPSVTCALLVGTHDTLDLHADEGVQAILKALRHGHPGDTGGVLAGRTKGTLSPQHDERSRPVRGLTWQRRSMFLARSATLATISGVTVSSASWRKEPGR